MTESEAPEASAPPETEEETGSLVFEQPLNERMRTFLRIDFLYNQALYHNEIASQWGSRAAMASLIDILAITTRGDVRSDVLKELERHLGNLSEFQSKPGVDPERLRVAAKKLTIPVLLVRGRMSDLLSEEGAQELLELVPHAQLVDVAGAGHMVAGDRNDLFNDAVVNFLESLRSA